LTDCGPRLLLERNRVQISVRSPPLSGMATASRASELKQQGALEAAQDPNSSVTAQAAERTVVEEAKKAGSAAFEFNPDASPEEKRAQARAVRTP
jgi:hypothetical protein